MNASDRAMVRHYKDRQRVLIEEIEVRVREIMELNDKPEMDNDHRVILCVTACLHDHMFEEQGVEADHLNCKTFHAMALHREEDLSGIIAAIADDDNPQTLDIITDTVKQLLLKRIFGRI